MPTYYWGSEGEVPVELTEEQAEGYNRFMAAFLRGEIEVIDLTDGQLPWEVYPVVYLGGDEHDTKMFEEAGPIIMAAIEKAEGR